MAGDDRTRRAWVWPLTPRGAAAIVVAGLFFAAAAATGTREPQYLGVALLVLVAAALILHHAVPPRVRVERRPDGDAVERGGRLRVTMRISSPARLTGRWHQPLPAGLADAADDDARDARAGLSRALGLDEIPEATVRNAAKGPRGTFRADEGAEEIAFSVTGRFRGAWTLPPVRLRIDDAFGLVRCAIDADADRPVLVVPPLVPLSASGAGGSDAGGSHAHARLRGQNAENLTPRPYAPGDSVRRVHWRASARHGDLMVRQEERETDRDATVVLDRDARRWPTTSSFERGVAAAGAIAWRLTEDGFAVRVVDDAGAPLALVDAPSSDAREHLQRALAGTAPREGPPTRLPHPPSPTIVAVLGTVDADGIDADGIDADGIDADGIGGLVAPGTRGPFLGALAVQASEAAVRAWAAAGWTVVPLEEDLAASWARLVDGPAPAGHRGQAERHGR